jgi:hypothetical protein
MKNEGQSRISKGTGCHKAQKEDKQNNNRNTENQENQTDNLKKK